MHIYISGFLVDDSEDDSLKFDLHVAAEFEQTVMDILNWKSLAEESDGELLLTVEHIHKISIAIKEQLPKDLDLFIGVISD